MGHPHLPGGLVVDEAEPPHPVHVAGEPAGHVVHEALVELVDDPEVTGKEALQHVQRPLLQRFRQQRVVRVGERLLRQGPRVVPVDSLLDHQEPHELRHRERLVGVVHLDRGLLGKGLDRVSVVPVAAQDVLQGAGDQQVLLAEAELLAGVHAVVRIEHLREVLCRHLLLHRGGVVALVEIAEVEFFVRPRGPEPQRVHVPHTVAGDRDVVGHAEHRVRADPADPPFAVAPEVDRDDVLGAGELPRVAETQPVVRLLDLRAFAEDLPEDAVLVPQAVPHRRVAEGGERVEEARGEPSEASVPEPGVHLEVDDLVPVEPQLPERLPARRLEAQVDEVVDEGAADQELHREEVDALDVLPQVGLLGQDPRVHHAVAHGVGEGEEPVVRGGALRVLPDRAPEAQVNVAQERAQARAVPLLVERHAGWRAPPDAQGPGQASSTPRFALRFSASDFLKSCPYGADSKEP